MEKLRPRPGRILDARSFEALGSDESPRAMAERAVKHYEEIEALELTWHWPRTCRQFAEDVLQLVDDPAQNPHRVRTVCDQFRTDSKNLKGILDLWFLHDWLLDQIEH